MTSNVFFFFFSQQQMLSSNQFASNDFKNIPKKHLELKGLVFM